MTRPPWHPVPDRAVRTWAERVLGPGWRVTRARRMPGGIAMATDALDLSGPAGAIARVVLRRWLRPGWQADDPELTPTREAAVLECLAGSGLPVPRVLALDAHGAESGSPALLMTHLDGRRCSVDEERRPHRVAAMGEALAAIHDLDAGLAAIAVPFAPYVDLERTVRPATRRPDLWVRAHAVAAHEPQAARPAFLHRDFHPGNTLWTGSRLTGIVDWTNASWGPPAADLGHWRANLGTRHGIAVADRATDAYRAAGGVARDQAWWDVRMLLDYVGDLDTAGPGVLDSTEAYLAALLARS